MHAMRTHAEEVASSPPMNTSIPLPPLPVSHTALFPLRVLRSGALLAIALSWGSKSMSNKLSGLPCLLLTRM